MGGLAAGILLWPGKTDRVHQQHEAMSGFREMYLSRELYKFKYISHNKAVIPRKRGLIAPFSLYQRKGSVYQIATRSSGKMYMRSPSVMP